VWSVQTNHARRVSWWYEDRRGYEWYGTVGREGSIGVVGADESRLSRLDRLGHQRSSDGKRQGLYTDPWSSCKSFCVKSSTNPGWQVRFNFTLLDLSGSVVPPWSRLYPLWI